MSDRQVHGRVVDRIGIPWQIVRYGRAGKWCAERDDLIAVRRSLPRARLTVRQAAELVALGQWNRGVPGGSTFGW